MPYSYDVVLAGRGGQGVLFLARVIGEAALHQGLGVRVTETHGMAMRGGSVLGFVRLGEGMGPLFRRKTASLLIALHQDEAAAGEAYLATDGAAVVNAAGGGERDGIGPRTHLVDADALSEGAGHPGSSNLALLGAAAARVDGFPLAIASIEAAILSLGKRGRRLSNLEVFRLGVGN